MRASCSLFTSVEWSFLIFGLCVAFGVGSFVRWTWNTEEYGLVSSYVRMKKLFSRKSKSMSFRDEPFRCQHEQSLGRNGQRMMSFYHWMWIWWGSSFLARLYTDLSFLEPSKILNEEWYLLHLILGYLEPIIGEGITWWELENPYWRFDATFCRCSFIFTVV